MRVLGVFAKYWSAGSVKTRLATTIGAHAAADLYREMLAWTLGRMRSAVADEYRIAYWPPESQTDFSVLAPDWKLEPQVAGDLGQRLAEFFQQQFARGATKVVVVGSDCLDLNGDLIQQAWRLLEQAPVVWGPASDGGYYLVGMNRPVPELFSQIAWSTDQVLKQSRTRVVETGLTDALLPELDDIDDEKSLRTWLERQSDSTDPEIRAWVTKYTRTQIRHGT